MEDMYINHLAVIVAAVASFAVGALWYGPPLFFNAWKKANGLTDEDLARANPVRNYGISFILALIICYNLAFFLSDADTDWVWGATAGLLAGFGWAAAAFMTIALYEMRSMKYILINVGYIIVYFTLAGFIIGIWR
ncbi:MAG: DUF1761 domain-containing protein [Saprospiraceae bacterium]|nr:DUF1761 domain-containing protein [Saprospiraceae bacterium]